MPHIPERKEVPSSQYQARSALKNLAFWILGGPMRLRMGTDGMDIGKEEEEGDEGD
jgi:hypothetical protein